MTPPLSPERTDSIGCTQELATVLLDWRADCERRLRTLTAVQRYLEHVRSPVVTSGERALLLQEIARLVGDTASDDTRWQLTASDLVRRLGNFS
jgi:hypothetical protein